MNKIIIHSLYSPDPWGHGGEKRTAQIKEICEDAGIKLVYYNYNKSQSRFPNFDIINAFSVINSVFRFESV